MMSKKMVLFYVVLSEFIFLWLAFFSIGAISSHVHNFFHYNRLDLLSLEDFPDLWFWGIIRSFYVEGGAIFLGLLVVAILESILVLRCKRYSAAELLTIHLCVLSLQVLALFSIVAMGIYVLECAKHLLISTDIPFHPLILVIFGFAWLIPAAAQVLLFLQGRMKKALTVGIIVAIGALAAYIAWWESDFTKTKLRESLRKPEPAVSQTKVYEAVKKQEEIEISADKKDKSKIPEFLEYLKDDSRMVRLAAARALLQVAGDEYVPTVVTLFKDPDQGVRAAVIVLLGKRRDPRIVPNLVEVLKTDKELRVRLFALDALRKIQDESCIPALIEALKECQIVRWQAQDALKEILLDDSNEPLCLAAINAVVANGRKEFLPDLQRLSKESKSELVRVKSLWAIDELQK